jgi:hypothetical protein
MRIRRDIASIPARAASDTWDAIVSLVTAKGSVDIAQLKAARSSIASLITDEFPAASPFILEGSGPQLRIYCYYGFAAIEAGSDIDPLTFNPTEGNWTLHVPCDAANLSWVQNALKATPRIKAFDLAKQDRSNDTKAAATTTATTTTATINKAEDIVIDWTAKG